MANYHVNAKGEARRCSAKNGGCPFGSEDHTEASSIKEARVFAEKRNEERANENERVANELAQKSQAKSAKDFAAIKNFLEKKENPEEVKALLAERKKIGHDNFMEKYDIGNDDVIETEQDTTEENVEEKKPVTKKRAPKKKASSLPKVAPKEDSASILSRIKKGELFEDTVDNLVEDENLAIQDKLTFTSYGKNGKPKKEQGYYVYDIFKNGDSYRGENIFTVTVAKIGDADNPVSLEKLYYEKVNGKSVIHSVNDNVEEGDEPFLEGTFTLEDKSNELHAENENREDAKPLTDKEGRESPYDVSPEIVKYAVESSIDGTKTKQVGKRIYDQNGEKIGFVYQYHNYDGEQYYMVDTYDETERDLDLEINENLLYLDGKDYKSEQESFDDIYLAAGGRGRWTKRQFEDVALPGL